jgi:Holliday junction DNA helicase RuvB
MKRARAKLRAAARGTPRIAGRLLRRVVDFALVDGDGTVTKNWQITH